MVLIMFYIFFSFLFRYNISIQLIVFYLSSSFLGFVVERYTQATLVRCAIRLDKNLMSEAVILLVVKKIGVALGNEAINQAMGRHTR